MPYITEELRKAIDDGMIPMSPGELNYQLSRSVDTYIKDQGGASYSNYNQVIGVLECLKLELYRRFIGPYEEKSLLINGEVFFHDPNRVKIPHV